MHGITEKDTMFSVKETPWHRLGKVIQEAPSIEEAIHLAGLNWTVGTKPMYTPDQMNEINSLGLDLFKREDLPKHLRAMSSAIYRTDTNENLGVGGPSYQPLQNVDAFKFFQPLIEKNEVQLETAGGLFGGKKIWVLAKVSGGIDDVAKGDAVENFVLLSNSHDGTTAIRCGFTPIRVVCNNTLSYAIDSKASKLLRIKHIGDPVKTLEKVREAMNLAVGEFNTTMEQYRKLANTPISSEDLERYVKIVFATKEQKLDVESEETSVDELTSGKRVMDEITQLFESGRGNDLPSIRGTYWAAYNAVTEHLTHNAGRTDENRLGSLWFGPNVSRNKVALKQALKMAA